MKYYENEITELKSRVTPDICKEVIAFANTKGGTIYIGIADHGEILGVEDPDSVILKISNQIRDAIKPDITMFIGYEILSIDDKKVLSVIVRKGTDRPYYLSSKGLRPSGVYVRNGTSADPATDTAIRKMIKETDGDSYETTRSLEQDLTFQAAEEQFRKRNVALDLNKMQTLGLISSDGMYSNTGLLLSDQCSHTIKAAVWSGLDKTTFQDRREFEGSLFRQMEEVYAYLDMHNQTKATFDGLYRKRLYEKHFSIPSYIGIILLVPVH